jgi:outer membrane protein assembly factor BamB
LRITGLTALSAGLLACTGCSGSTQPEAALDGAAGIDRVDSGTTADGNAALDDAASWAADSMAPGDATLSAGDATASSVGSDGSTVSPADAGDATLGADAADAGPPYLSDAGADAADAGLPYLSDAGADADDAAPRHLSDAGPTSSMVTAYLNNPAHTSSALDPSLAPPLAAIWSFAPSRGVSISYPLIAGGHVYFVYWGNTSGSTAQLIAVDERTGATIWGPLDLGVDRLAGQAYDGQQVFSADATGVVRSFDAATGAPGWKTTLSSGSAAQPTAYKGFLYVATSGALTALDETTGHVTWTAPLSNGGSATSPAVTDDGVFASAACGDLSAFDRSTGSLLWHHLSTCDGFGGVPMIFDGRAYVAEGVPGAKVDMFDVRTGGLLGSLPCFISPAFDEGQAYCNQRTPLQAFDLTTGTQAWSFGGDRQLNLGPFAAAGTVYVASDTGMMFGVDEATGAQVWSTEVDNLGASSFTVGGEGILLTQLYAGAGVVAYAHVDAPDASVVVGDSKIAK